MSVPSPLPSTSMLSRLRVVQRSFLTRRGGRRVARSSVAVEYRPALQKKVGDGNYERVINAEVLHGDEQRFWGERRGFYRKAVQYFPTWDRLAQALILLTRHAPRVPQEMAFRLMVVFLKLMLLPQIVMGAELMLPLWVAGNAEGIIGQAVLEKEKGETNTGEKVQDAKKLDRASDEDKS